MPATLLAASDVLKDQKLASSCARIALQQHLALCCTHRNMWMSFPVHFGKSETNRWRLSGVLYKQVGSRSYSRRHVQGAATVACASYLVANAT
jgi:hypothetical protein